MLNPFGFVRERERLSTDRLNIYFESQCYSVELSADAMIICDTVKVFCLLAEVLAFSDSVTCYHVAIPLIHPDALLIVGIMSKQEVGSTVHTQ